ncbi:unnamed protein product, partial [Brachionus calyciflorus]
MSEYELVPTSKVKQFLFYQDQFYYKLKPVDKNGITIWRCRLYYDADVRCKILLRSNENGEVVSISGVHQHFDKDVKPAEAIIKNAVQRKDKRKCRSMLNNGGVHVIQTFFSDDPSEEIQIMGRTARQGETKYY